MPARYQVVVKNHFGVQVALLTEWVRLEYTRRVNAPDTHVLVLPADLNIAEELHHDSSTDYQIEVWRRDSTVIPAYPWTLDYEGFHLSSVHEVSEAGRQRVTSYGRGYDDLLVRRAVLYPSGSAGSAKSGPGETAMKAFVEENAGASATAPPRLYAGVTAGLTVEATVGGGAAWEGARAWRNLMEVVQDIAHATLVDFKVVGNGTAAFQFRAHAYPWGIDRSTQGLEPATGRNAAGNSPVIFSYSFGNMRQSTHSHSHTDEANVVVMLGQGLEDARETVAREDPTAQGLTPWNRREITRNANQESTVAGLEAAGDTLLHDLQAREVFHFAALQAGQWLYGRDYQLGDIVTAHHTTDRHFQIVGVTVVVEAGRETVTLDVREDD